MARNTTQKGGRFAPATTTAKSNNRVERLVFTRLADAQLLLDHGNPTEATRKQASAKIAFAQWVLRENTGGALESLSDVALYNRFLEANPRFK